MHGPVLLANLIGDFHSHRRQALKHIATTLGAGYGVGEVGSVVSEVGVCELMG
jgi:hypothetical protein